jgi:hypothetical protein
MHGVQKSLSSRPSRHSTCVASRYAHMPRRLSISVARSRSCEGVSLTSGLSGAERR